jgi:hypothetical protein
VSFCTTLWEAPRSLVSPFAPIPQGLRLPSCSSLHPPAGAVSTSPAFLRCHCFWVHTGLPVSWLFLGEAGSRASSRALRCSECDGVRQRMQPSGSHLEDAKCGMPSGISGRAWAQLTLVGICSKLPCSPVSLPRPLPACATMKSH